MGKLVAFCGSPRKEGITRKLVNRVIDGAKAEGMEVVFFDLNTPGIRGCQACMYCRTHEGCAMQDPLHEMYAEIASADAILFGAPIYFYNLSGQAKVWLDRLYPMFDTPSYESRYPGKKFVTVFAQGYDDPTLYTNVIEDMNGLFNGWGWESVDSLLYCGGDKKAELPEQLLDRAYEAGRKLSSSI